MSSHHASVAGRRRLGCRPVAEARVDRLAVLLHLAGEECPVGTLAWSRTTRTTAFEFDRRFAARGLAISPFHLPAGPDVRTAPPTPFDGLFGVFADSLPDGWGRLLLDRKLRALGYVRAGSGHG